MTAVFHSADGEQDKFVAGVRVGVGFAGFDLLQALVDHAVQHARLEMLANGQELLIVQLVTATVEREAVVVAIVARVFIAILGWLGTDLGALLRLALLRLALLRPLFGV